MGLNKEKEGVLMSTILIIEDDNDINNMLFQLLSNHQYQVVRAYSGTEGILLHGENVDLILLDLMLPGKNGQEIIKVLKRKHFVPVIVMSAIHEIDMKLDLFKLGADDYVTKPFNNQELLARIKVHLRNQSHREMETILKYKDLELNTENFIVKCNGEKVPLTKCEFEILKVFLENTNQVLTKSVLFDRVWGDADSADDNTLNVHISKIRNKLKEKNSKTEYIETVWSIGYRLKK